MNESYLSIQRSKDEKKLDREHSQSQIDLEMLFAPPWAPLPSWAWSLVIKYPFVNNTRSRFDHRRVLRSL
jgi:hypothetical protein